MQIINNNGKIGQQINIKTSDTPLNLSDKITKTVVCEIEPSGDCGKCNGLIKPARYCMPFGLQLKSEIDWQYNSTYEQCQACREFLSERKSRVYCENKS